MQPDFIASRYRVVRAIGRGGMGTVWLCADETLHRQVAVKQIGSLPGESSGDTARAMREARLTAALNHKNAVSIYDVVEHDGTTWLVMEYVPSQTLSQLLASVGQLPPGRVAHIGAQVAAALSSAHSLGIVHRDIKPGNILVGTDDQAKISDFGIARGHEDLHLTQTGLVTGTPAFFSPELARGAEPSFASDVWAFGITLYTATEGSPPHEHQSSPLAILSAITQEPLRPPTHAGPLTGVLAGMLQPDARQRSTMAETLEALRAVERQASATETAGDTLTVAAGTPASNEQSDQISIIRESVEPAYEKTVVVPPVPPNGSAERMEHKPPPRDRSSFGRLAMTLLALLVLAGAGALLWNTLDLGTDPADPISSNSDPAGTKTEATPPEKDDPRTSPAATSDAPAEDPTTGAPTEDDPPTEDPTTEPPTEDPTTEAPTEDPTTEAPTEDPTTEAPTEDDPTTEAPTEDDPTTEPPTEAATDPEDFTLSYFSTVPADLDAGWSLIAPSMKAGLGRASYDSFWGSVESVDVSNVEAVDDQTVRYQITYNFSDRADSIEVKELTLLPNKGSYLIASDTRVG